ncbi:MAG: alpha/beta fold hydrolase [Actinomycetota bacterium]|nr:alpha/beta fold hydrolase [Actinomycetota bacterium]
MSASCPVVLVHGAWHGAWCFAALQNELDALGVPSYAIDLPGHGASAEPLCGLHGDAAHVAAVLRRLGAPAVLVGHSYGGAVVTQAAALHPEVAHLVYLAAFALADGESVNGLLRSLPRGRVALGEAMQAQADGTITLNPALTAAAVYGEVPPATVEAALVRLSPQSQASFTDVVSGSPREAIASTYVRCLRDDSVHITHQDAMAARCGTTLTLDTGHSPFMSHPADTAALLAAVVRQVTT